jgi:hypothetical protein
MRYIRTPIIIIIIIIMLMVDVAEIPSFRERFEWETIKFCFEHNSFENIKIMKNMYFFLNTFI